MAAFTSAEIQAKITKYKLMLTGLEDVMDKMALTGDVQQYNFNDGQSVISTTYKNQSEVLKAMRDVETMIERWSNKLDGRLTILRDFDTLPRVN